jgi:hypothetical protein
MRSDVNKTENNFVLLVVLSCVRVMELPEANVPSAIMDILVSTSKSGSVDTKNVLTLR